jgi:DNA polymerase
MRIQSHIDFETFGTAGYKFDGTRWCSISNSPPHGLGAVGTAVYAEHPDTEVISLTYTVNDAYHLWVYGCKPPTALFEIIRNGGLIGAWHSLFEYFIWRHQCHLKMGWPELPYEQTVDIMAHSYAHSLPGGLDNCAAILGTTQKDKEGKRLIRKFSLPRSPTKSDSRLRLTIYDDLADGQKFLDYNVRDVQAEVEIANRIPHLSEFERRVWLCDQAINIRGVQIDTELLDKLINFYNGIERKLNAELQDLTGEVVSTVNENKKLTEWLRSRVGSIKIGGLTKAEVKHYLTLPIPPDCHRVLEIRQILGQSSVKKLFAIKRRLCSDGRLRGLFQYAGADRTGRWAGRGPQAQNLVKLKAETAVFDIQTLDELLERYDRPVTAIASCLRSCFVAKDEYDLVCSDFSAIEAIGMAMMAGEQWRIDVFRTHGKIYEMSASKITGIPFDEFQLHKERTGEHHPLRSKIGKVAELASAYGGWINAWKNFGADEHFPPRKIERDEWFYWRRRTLPYTDNPIYELTTDEQIREKILRWRHESPNIVAFWGGQYREAPLANTSWKWEFGYKVSSRIFYREYHGLEGAAVQAILDPGKEYSYREISYYVHNDILYCRLPSGRNLTYHNPQLETVIDRYSRMEIYRISYMGWNTDPKKGPRGWIRLYTHGGKLAENIIQAACREIMANAMVNLEDANYPLVLHVHDEPIAEVPKGFGSIEEMECIMSVPPDWAHDWPIKATGGWRGRRFRKED